MLRYIGGKVSNELSLRFLKTFINANILVEEISLPNIQAYSSKTKNAKQVKKIYLSFTHPQRRY